jgi:hypothetical protein
MGIASPLRGQRVLTPGDRIRISYAPINPNVIEHVSQRPRCRVREASRRLGVCDDGGAGHDGVRLFEVSPHVDVSTATYRPVAKGAVLGTA